MVQAGASLRTGDLQRNSAASSEAIYDLIYKGKGKMPGYGKECAPKVRGQEQPQPLRAPLIPGCRWCALQVIQL